MAKKKSKNLLDPKIKQMVCANHGGMDNASDAAILNLWNRLGPDVQKRYAEKQKGAHDADSD